MSFLPIWPRRARDRWLGAAAATACLLGAAAADAQSVWELTPYRVRVSIAIDPVPELTFASDWDQRLRASLVERADSVIGARWELTVGDTPPALTARMLSDLANLSGADLPVELLDLPVDKIALVAVKRRGPRFEVAVREFDVRTRLFGAAWVRAARRRAELAPTVFRGLVATFAPLAQVEQVEDKKVIVRVKGEALPVRDASLQWIRPGDALRPVLRFNDREGKAKRIEAMDWTLLTVQEANGAELTCHLHSGLRSPLSGRRRGRVEQLALVARAANLPTRLELFSRGTDSRRLRGYDIYSHPADRPETTWLGRTGADGAIDIPPDGGAVRVLFVKNGVEPLARLPMLPGLEPVLTAELPDDDQRLAAEGLLTGLQEGFVDLVARRAMLMTRIRARLEEGKLDEAKTMLDELRRLGSQRQIIQAIDQQQQKSASEDTGTQRKIDRLFNDTKEVVNRFLNQAEIDQLETDLSTALRSRGETPPPDA